MHIGSIIQVLEEWAPLPLQESYDNSGLLTGQLSDTCTGVLVTLDCTEETVSEARTMGCNLIVAHHPILFSGLKRLTGHNYMERTLIAAIKNDIAIYALHTNLDNIQQGVNQAIAARLGLQDTRILAPKGGALKKLYTFVPEAYADAVRTAIFQAGGGHIGNYSECSFSSAGMGSFKPEGGSNPFTGEKGKRHEEKEIKLEIVFPAWLQNQVVEAMKQAHPYEEVAYDLLSLDNDYQGVGAGLVGKLVTPLSEALFLQHLCTQFQLSVVRHTKLLGKPIQKVAVCGGAGSFLTKAAIRSGADVYVTADVKYHEFFDADGQLLLADIGHWESEQFTIDLIVDYLTQKFPTFAVLKTEVLTNPVAYYKY